jgi:hypothetical protein
MQPLYTYLMAFLGSFTGAFIVVWVVLRRKPKQ